MLKEVAQLANYEEHILCKSNEYSYEEQAYMRGNVSYR